VKLTIDNTDVGII